MNEAILATNKLSKRYGENWVLMPTDLELRKGQVLGLVGRNGAGKTTLLRLITGQTRPTEGELSLFGSTSEADLCRARRRTGAIVEAPCFYANLSAADNLEYYRIQRGIPDKGRISQILYQVGLSAAEKKKYKNFSLGMKQRLGIALALLSSPDLLILDEPLNGLDPMGIAEMRRLLLQLNQEKNISILISSHILTELSTVATDYAFLDKGNLMERISAADLHRKCRRYLEVQVDNPEKAAALLEQKLSCREYEVLPQAILHIHSYLDQPGEVSRLLTGEGITLLSMEVKDTQLEEYFISLVGGERNA